jgi:hypothetical protein
MANFSMDAKFKSKKEKRKKKRKKMHVGRWVGCNEMLWPLA